MKVVCNKAEGCAIFQENEKFPRDGSGTLIDTFHNIVKHSCFKRDNCIWKFSNDIRVIHQRHKIDTLVLPAIPVPPTQLQEKKLLSLSFKLYLLRYARKRWIHRQGSWSSQG